MELLEIVRGLGTSEATVERALAFARAIGKTPIVVRDTPGFATSRLGVILGAEAMRMLECGRRERCATSTAPWSSATATRWARSS